MGVEVDVLGPLRVRADGAERGVTGRRERAVLGLLVAAGGRQVGGDRIVDEVWGDDPPASAPGSVQVAVSKLRKLLGHESIVRGPGGYALSGVAVDAAAFATLVQRAAAAAPAQAFELSERALALWRGQPFEDLTDVPGLATEATRLGDDLLRLHEIRAGALLDQGRAAQAQAELAAVAAEHPFRERLWSLHALALYRCDRQADALAALRTLREALDTELGVDPSPSVRALEEQILRQDPSLAGPAPAAPAPSSAAPAPDTVTVVGRDDLLDRLGGHLGALAHGRGGLVLLGGEAGIGKTALAEALAERARAAGVDVARGRCHEGDLAPAYWPWLPVLRGLADQDGAAPDDARVLALLGGAGGEEETAGPEAAGATTMRTFDAVARWLGRRADPLLVVLEDLHWADLTSLRLLAYVAEELRDRPLLVVGTSRPVDARRQPAHAQALAGLTRLGAQRVGVPPLDADGVGALLRTSGLLPERAVALAPTLAARCDGNPFFVLETARLLGDGSDDAGEVEVPQGVADVLRLRVQRLDPTAQEALGAAAVVGREFDPLVLAAVLPAGRRPLDDLEEALAAGVVQEGEEPGRLRFVHALARETVYRDLPVGRRAAGHAAAGRALAARLPQDPELLPEVAHHHLVAAAYLPEVAADAVRYAVDAARAAERRSAFVEGVGLWEQAVAAERRAEPDPAAPGRRHDLLLALALARQRLGDIAGMIAALDEAVAHARRDDDVVRMAEAATGYRSSGVWHWREMGDDQPEVRAVLEYCLDRVTDLGLQARLWAQLGLEHYVVWHPDAEPCTERAVTLARESGDPRVLRDCLVGRATTLWAPGRAPDRLVLARELLTVCDTAEYELAALCHLGTALHIGGDYVAADEALARAYALADRLRFSGADLFLTWLRWLRALESDDPEAPAIAQRALALHRRTSMVGLLELGGLVVLEGEGDHPGVPADLVAGAQDHPHPGYRSGVAAALARVGRVDEGLTLVVDDEPVGVDYASMYGACRRLEVLAAARHPALAEAVAALTPYRGTVATYGSVVSLGAVDLFLGIGQAALGDDAGARASWQAALEMNARNGARRWVRRAEALLGR